MVTTLIALSVLAVPPVHAASREAIEAMGDSLVIPPPVPDKHGFMQWQWVRPPGKGEHFSSIERARAKFVSDKDDVITIRTQAGQLVKIDFSKLGRESKQWVEWNRKQPKLKAHK